MTRFLYHRLGSWIRLFKDWIGPNGRAGDGGREQRCGDQIGASRDWL